MVNFDRDAGLLGVEAGESFFGEQEGQMTEPVSARVEALKASLVGVDLVGGRFIARGVD